MMRAPIHAVDHSIGRAGKLVVEPARYKTPSDRRHGALVTKHEIVDAPLDALCGQSSMDAFDDVGTFPQRPHGGLGVLRQVPSRWSERFRESNALELPHARDHR